MSGDEITGTSNTPSTGDEAAQPPARRTRRRAASRPAGPPEPSASVATVEPPSAGPASEPAAQPDLPEPGGEPVKKATARRRTKKSATTVVTADQDQTAPAGEPGTGQTAVHVAEPEPADSVTPPLETSGTGSSRRRRSKATATLSPIFQPPDPALAGDSPEPAGRTDASAPTDAASEDLGAATADDAPPPGGADGDGTGSTASRRRRSRGGRNRRKPGDPSGADTNVEVSGTDVSDTSPDASGGDAEGAVSQQKAKGGKTTAGKPATGKASSAKGGATSSDGTSESEGSAKNQQSGQDDSGSASSTSAGEAADGAESTSTSSSRRRRRRRRTGDSADTVSDSANEVAETAVKVRAPRTAPEAITSVEGSTRIEAKKQRRREGREAGRRRAPILSESEFLARRESVDRVMVIRQRGEVSQIAVLEDSLLVEHYVAHQEQSSLIGNVYLGRVQNVLPSMEAAFIDIGRGRNAVLYAGEVNWDLVGDRNQPRRIENALKAGQQILVQVSKDPVGHKGARLTSQISLPGRYLVYVPGGGSSGISRKLADTERSRLKNLLKDILPDESGVIVRTAAEGASEEELTRDVTRLTERWAEISKLVKAGKAPALLYAEPDITLKVVRDLFTEDFARLIISGDEAWEMVDEYVSYVAPDLADRLERFDGAGDVFDNFRVEEQIAKALERKVWLPSGGSLVIDRTEAMTVVDVNTGKFTGSGGNLEQTVTKNNLEAAEEIVRQLRLRDIGGIIVIDFIDMVLENNRDLVLRRLVECLGRDRTRHQVAEVTSLGLVQMTRKRIGTGLLEAFSVPCDKCHGRGVIIELEPVTERSEEQSHAPRSSSSKRSSRSRGSTSAVAPPAVDKIEMEKHATTAAATAAIAAALHPEQTATDSPGMDGSEPALAADLVPENAPEAEVTLVEPTATVAAKKAPRKRAAAATTKTTTTKKASTTKKATTKKATTKKATTKRASAAKATTSPVGPAPVLAPPTSA